MEFTDIGYLSKTHGVKGQLILRADKEVYFEEVKVVFLESSTGLAPHFVKRISPNNVGFIIELEETDTVEKAKLLIGKKIFVDAELVELVEEDSNWVGFELSDKNFGDIGKVFEVNDNGVQILLSIMHKNKEIILPLVNDFIEKIDETDRKIYYNAPEGLIDVYLKDV